MTVRKRRKKDKQRAMRTHGHGNTKNARGAGSRGGRGRAGSHKHKYSKYYDSFGGTKSMKAAKKGNAVNLSEMDSIAEKLIAKNKAEKIGDEIIIDGSIAKIDKILARGTFKNKLVFKNVDISERARAKIIEAGGRIEDFEEEVSVEKAKTEDVE